MPKPFFIVLSVFDDVNFANKKSNDLGRLLISKENGDWHFNINVAPGRKLDDLLPILKELGYALTEDDWSVINEPPTNARN